MEDEQKTIERQTAKIVSIKELTSGKYVKQEGWMPNYILTKKKEKISRVNLIAVVVTVPDNAESIFLDDGTGKIEVRSFDDRVIFKDLTIADIIRVIGKPREFNNTIYINAEIIKKIMNKDWLEYRKKEILLKNIKMPDLEEEKTGFMLDNENNIAIDKESDLDKIDEILIKIKELDKGNGCLIQELVAKYPKAEEIIENLLLKGEIFEISPGKVKILE